MIKCIVVVHKGALYNMENARALKNYRDESIKLLSWLPHESESFCTHIGSENLVCRGINLNKVVAGSITYASDLIKSKYTPDDISNGVIDVKVLLLDIQYNKIVKAEVLDLTDRYSITMEEVEQNRINALNNIVNTGNAQDLALIFSILDAKAVLPLGTDLLANIGDFIFSNAISNNEDVAVVSRNIKEHDYKLSNSDLVDLWESGLVESIKENNPNFLLSIEIKFKNGQSLTAYRV